MKLCKSEATMLLLFQKKKVKQGDGESAKRDFENQYIDNRIYWTEWFKLSKS